MNAEAPIDWDEHVKRWILDSLHYDQGGMVGMTTQIDWDERVNVTLTRWQARVVAMWIKGQLSMVDNPYAPYPHPVDTRNAALNGQ